jgi:hypothetical protein
MHSKIRKISSPGEHRESASAAPNGTAFLARLQALGPRGEPWITHGAAKRKPVKARSVVALRPELVGRDVLVCIAEPERVPVIIGFLQDLVLAPSPHENAEPLALEVDRERIVLSARQEVVLRCGPGSITLTADGKVVVRGVEVVSSANRTNRIRGGAVRIN